MARSGPLLGETMDRSRAFPDIASLDLKVVQDPWEQYARLPRQRESRYGLSNIPRQLACLNPRCRQGGLDLQQIVLFSPPGERRHQCGGHEGSAAGRRRGDPCDNCFDVSLAVVRRGAGAR